MIRIELSPEPQWLDLGHGVRLKLLALTTALMVATRSDPAVQDLDPEDSNNTRAAVFATALARRAVTIARTAGSHSHPGRTGPRDTRCAQRGSYGATP